jgi:hypothetical protein
MQESTEIKRSLSITDYGIVGALWLVALSNLLLVLRLAAQCGFC